LDATTEIKLQIACTDADGNSLVLSVMFASAANLDNASASALFTPKTRYLDG
jgi:hypothetical protein